MILGFVPSGYGRDYRRVPVVVWSRVVGFLVGQIVYACGIHGIIYRFHICLMPLDTHRNQWRIGGVDSIDPSLVMITLI